MALSLILLAGSPAGCPIVAQEYVPTADNLKAREAFSAEKFGIFLHWGIYSTFAQGEWYLETGKLHKDEYAKAASAFYPIRFNAAEWARAFREAGARYVCFTSRHHDGFSMFHTRQSTYNIVDATPFGRDVMKELADACRSEGLNFHLYYSLLDWTREDYPPGIHGRHTGRTGTGNYDSYFNFMKNQLTEILTHYGPIGGIWFDGWWDHRKDTPPFDWRLPELYRHIHGLQPACLITNNHHVAPFPGEDAQTFERDLPGENKAGLSTGVEVSRLPLEMCQTMNGMWGYKVADQNYKSARELIQLLVRAAAKGANLLLNIGPQPNGELPQAALQRLKEMGQWTSRYGETLYGTLPTGLPEAPWGVTLRKGRRIFVHILAQDSAQQITLPIEQKVLTVSRFDNKEKLPHKWTRRDGLTFAMPPKADMADLVVEVLLKEKK